MNYLFNKKANSNQHKDKSRYTSARYSSLLFLFCAAFLISGCHVGSKLYQTSFTQYNNAVRNTLDEQMLANLVRIRYYESPIFLQVSSLNTSFVIGGNIGGSAGANGAYGASIGGSYEERPTISFSMPESQAYYGRMLAPLSATQVTSLVLAGFDSELIFRTVVRGINGTKNLSSNFDNHGESESNTHFKEVSSLIKKLISEGIIDMELGGKETSWSSPVSVNPQGELSKVLLLGAASYAMSNDAEIVNYPDGSWQTHRYEKHMALRFAPSSDTSVDAQRLRELLALKKDRYNFPIVEAEMVNAEKARGVLGQSPGALDPSINWVEIGLRGRSMLEIMQVASKEVRVPDIDIQKGYSTNNKIQNSDNADNWFVVKSSEEKPSNSSISVEYRGHWFYIEDTDLHSRQTFAMLTAVYAVVGGTVPGAHPVLTLPVGN